jgi:hypothetical protein
MRPWDEKETFQIDNCVFTHNQSYLSKVDDYDALVFSAFTKIVKTNPTVRKPNQIYVFVTFE